ncbi:alkylresorcinol/alkylpyrone synthase [Phycisphaerales bacterium]|nr:alkylresorcinol/alkylpyrone synthase [Phycisphaerales bacterium]
MTARLLSIATNVPAGGMSQALAAELAAHVAGFSPRRARAVRTLYERSGIERRGLVVADEQGRQEFYIRNGEPAGPTTAARMAAYADACVPLALPACREALELARVLPREVTHVVLASCTGFDAPGADQAIIHALGLPTTVRRTLIGFMGCHAAINALAVAKAFADADPHAVVLVCCVEVCSLHFSYTDEPGHTLANALFADGAAAAVVRASPREHDADSPTILSTSSILLPDSADCMSWHIGDAGFQMRLSARVPELLASHVPAWIDACLTRQGLARADIGGWAIHPGGPRVVTAVQQALGLPQERVEASLSVLREHGNMSSPTVLFILKRLWDSGIPRPWVGMAFGPGLAGEGVVVG